MSIKNYKSVRNTADIVVLTTSNRTDEKNLDIRKVKDKALQVLLVKRTEQPFGGTWVLPGGFIDAEKPITQCVKDKLEQKTSLRDVYTEQLYTYGDDIHRDPRDRVITIAYIALVNKARIIEADKTDNKQAWFWVNATRDNNGTVVSVTFERENNDKWNEPLIINNLGFDHSKIIIDALNRLSNKIMYTDIVFNALEEQFTIKELQLVYETILGRSIPGFRRIIGPKICETGFTTSDIPSDRPNGHRPAKLYTKLRSENKW